MREQFRLLAIILTVILFPTLFLTHLNLMAKRIRNIRLPDWRTLLAIILAGILVSALVSQNASNILSTLVWLALLLIPSGAFSSS